jgi:hypothetical protein
MAGTPETVRQRAREARRMEEEDLLTRYVGMLKEDGDISQQMFLSLAFSLWDQAS